MPGQHTIQQVQVGNNAIVEIGNEFATCKLSLHGGHLLSYVPHADHTERLWLSADTALDGSESIRGGIPICWPWFADQRPPGFEHLSAHGFARTQLWHLIDVSHTSKGTQVTLNCPNTQQTGFQGQAKLNLLITIGKTLTVSLVTLNTGSTTFSTTQALHTYLAVADLEHTQICGLDGDYLDKHQGLARHATPRPYQIGGPVDNIHLQQPPQVILQHATNRAERRNIHMAGHDSVVVWNPWTGANDIANMPADGYRDFICVEAAITNLMPLAPGASHTLTQEVA